MTTPTGTVEQRDGRHVLVLTREFSAPVEDVWAAVTESDRLARWIGSWTGDPDSGSVAFQMLFEGECPEETMEILACVPPHRLHVRSGQGDTAWLLEVELAHEAGVTTLTLVQLDVTADQAADWGPGWEYYLDRLADAESGADPAGRDFDRDYYPAMAEHFRGQF